MTAMADENLDLEQIREHLQFDPFEPGAKFGAGADGEQQGETDGEQQASSQEKPAAGDEPADKEGGAAPQGKSPSDSSSQQPADGKTPEAGEDDQKRAIETLQGLVSKLLEQPSGKTEEQGAPKTQEAKPQGEAKPEDQAPYKMQVPPQVAEAIASDDPALRQTAISALASAVMNQLYRDFSQAITAMREQVRQEMLQVVPQQLEAREKVREVQQDFYTAFPDLERVAKSSKLAHDTMWGVVSQLAQAAKVQDWNQEFRNQAGEYIHQVLGIPRSQTAGQQNGQQDAGRPAPKRAPFAAGGSSRPGGSNANGAANPKQNEFLEVLFAGS